MNYKNIASLIAIVSIVNLSAPTIKVLADEVGEFISINTPVANVNIFNNFDNEAYNEAFKIDSRKIASIKNNAGNWSDKVIQNAIDGDLNTHWETNKGNTSEWNNEVEVEFVESVVLDRVVYGARINDQKGFAEEFEIYTSNTLNDDNYQLVAVGKHNKVSSLIEAKFEPTEFKRLKFRYKKSSQNWATANEFLFYTEDKLSKEVGNLFTDNTYSNVKEEYRNIGKLNNLRDKAMNHPFKESLIVDIDLAIKIVQENINYSENILVAYQEGDMKKHAKDLGMNRAGQNMQPTGFYALPGEIVTVYAEVDYESGLMPSLLFSQNEGKYTKWTNTIKLRPGKNEIVVPEIDISEYTEMPKPGGAIYISNPYTPEEQGKAPVIRFEGASKYPYFKEGDDEEAFIKDLKEYKSRLDADNESGQNKVLDIVEIESDRMILSGTTSGAYKVYVEEGLKLTETTDFWDNIMDETFKFYGLDGSSPNQDPKNLKEHIRLAQKHGLMYASGNHIGVQRGHMELILDPNRVQKSYWGLIHEIGHRLDISSREWTEYTNNMVSMNLSYLFDDVNKDKFPLNDLIYPKAIDPNRPAFEASGFVEGLAMFWQLNIYDHDYWTKLNRLYREELPKIQNEQHKKDVMVEYSSRVLNIDLTEHFERHGFVASNEVKQRIKATYPPLNKKLWYLNDYAYDYQGKGFKKDDTSTIKRVNAEGVLYIESDLSSDDLLGYEILRDGELIGFTSTNTFKDINREIDVKYKYQVIPYANDLSIGGISKEYNSLSPLLEINDNNIQVNLYEEFNSKKYVKALSNKGIDISDKIKVTHNVNTSKRGNYSVKYSVEENGIKVEKEKNVEVVSNSDYASDIKWESAVSGWGNVSKDNAVGNRGKIKLIVNDEIKEFDKGLGAAINGEIVYNIEGKGYAYFTTYVGAEKNYNDHRTSVVFKIIADGKEVYSTGVIKSDSEAEFIKIPLEGVKELRLILADADGKGNGDYASWGDAKFYRTNSIPTLELDGPVCTTVGEPIKDIVGSVVARDLDDGDISSKVVVKVPENINYNKPGKYTVTYSVTDSDNKTVSKERYISVVDIRDSKAITDYEWSSAVQSYKEPNKDKNLNGEQLRLTDENGNEVVYERGIGSHANSTIIYDLTDKNYDYFTSYVGVDRVMYGNTSSVSFEVYVDGLIKYDSGVMKSTDPQKFVEVPINGAKELKLVVKDGGDGRGQDHATWGDTKLYFINSERADLTKLEEIIEEAECIDRSKYTEKTFKNLDNIVKESKEALNLEFLSQIKCDELINNIENAINNLEPLDKSTIEDVNKDGIVDINDIAIVASKYNITNKDRGWRKNLDINDDRIIDIFDLVLISKKISERTYDI